jgi:hypothetical protein
MIVSRPLFFLILSLLLLPTVALAQETWDGWPEAEAPVETLPVEEPPPPQVAPLLLKIPALGVLADVVPVGEDIEGAMDVPPHPDMVAWWSLGAGTGVPGNVVLAAHVDWGGRLRVFGLLHLLGPGDQVVVVDEQLREFTYEVSWSRWVPAEGAPIEEFFSNSDTSEITLITCGGVFDQASRQYLERLVVRAQQVWPAQL